MNNKLKLKPIYRLKVHTDWYELQDRYFYSQDTAIESLKKTSGFHFDSVHNMWLIDLAKEVRVTRRGDGMTIKGIPAVDDYAFNLREPKEFALASITKLYVSGDIIDDRLYVLRKCNKKELNKTFTQMKSFKTVNDPAEFIHEQDWYFRDAKILAVSFSKSYIKKIARNKYKDLARLWNYKEFKQKIYEYIEHPENFSGKGVYMSIREFYVK